MPLRLPKKIIPGLKGVELAARQGGARVRPMTELRKAIQKPVGPYVGRSGVSGVRLPPPKQLAQAPLTTDPVTAGAAGVAAVIGQKAMQGRAQTAAIPSIRAMGYTPRVEQMHQSFQQMAPERRGKIMALLRNFKDDPARVTNLLQTLGIYKAGAVVQVFPRGIVFDGPSKAAA